MKFRSVNLVVRSKENLSSDLCHWRRPLKLNVILSEDCVRWIQIYIATTIQHTATGQCKQFFKYLTNNFNLLHILCTKTLNLNHYTLPENPCIQDSNPEPLSKIWWATTEQWVWVYKCLALSNPFLGPKRVARRKNNSHMDFSIIFSVGAVSPCCISTINRQSGENNSYSNCKSKNHINQVQ